MKAIFAILLLSLLPPAHAATHPFFDLDFEAPECTGGWFMGRPGYDGAVDSTVAHSGRQSFRVRYTAKAPWNDGLFSPAFRQFPVADAAGRKIRFSGFIKTEGIASGWAGLWWRADGETKTVAFDNMEGRGPHGTTGWARYQIELDVPAETKGIVFGFLLAGDGTAWLDDLAIEVGGARWTEGPPPSSAPPGKEAVVWLKSRAIPFDTPEAGHGFADLRPLKKLVGNARVVALGEATHGTREFFQMKHRVTEFLASEMGFTLFAIEANMPEAYRINDYVLTGKGDPKELIKGMYFWTWDTQEVLDMVEWMRRFNQSGKGRIQFLGFDMQTPAVAAQNVRDFLARAEPAYAAEAGTALASVEALAALTGPPPPDKPAPDPKAAAGGVRAVVQHLEGKRGDYAAQIPPGEVDWAIQNARVVLQSAEMFASAAPRDRSMADNVDWILRQAPAGSKIVLWAHNFHVSRQNGAMGKFLAERFGKDMVVLGFAFGEGRYTAKGADGLRDYPARPPVAGSVESYFRAAGLPRFILDLRGLPAGSPAASWLAEPRLLRQIGALAMQCGYDPAVPADLYDALIYFDKTTPSVLLRIPEKRP